MHRFRYVLDSLLLPLASYSSNCSPSSTSPCVFSDVRRCDPAGWGAEGQSIIVLSTEALRVGVRQVYIHLCPALAPLSLSSSSILVLYFVDARHTKPVASQKSQASRSSYPFLYIYLSRLVRSTRRIHAPRDIHVWVSPRN
jgi:hypothetical protein